MHCVSCTTNLPVLICLITFTVLMCWSLVGQTDTVFSRVVVSNTQLFDRLQTAPLVLSLWSDSQDGAIVPMYKATFLDTWKQEQLLGVQQIGSVNWSTGRLQRYCLAEIICQRAILPQQSGYFHRIQYCFNLTVCIVLVLSRSEYSRLAVSRVDSHWKATTEGASQKSFLVCKFKRVQLVGLQHQHEPRL